MECSVCLEHYNSATRKPLILPCGHTVCQSCCVTHLSMDRFCPMCRQAVPSQIDQLQINFALMFDLQPSQSTANAQLTERKEALRRTVGSLMASLEVDKEVMGSVQVKWRALKQDQQAACLRLCSTLEHAGRTLQEAAERHRKELHEMEKGNEAQVQGQLSEWQDRLQAKLQAIEELSAMLAEKVPFSEEKVTELERQLTRWETARPRITVRTVLIAQDLSAKAAALVEELTTRALNTGVKLLQAEPPIIVPTVESDVGRRTDRNKEIEPKPERPSRGHIDHVNPFPGVRWAWIKKNGSVKSFHYSDSQALEKAYQSGAKQLTISNHRTGAVDCVVDLKNFLSFKAGKRKPRRVQRVG